MHVGTIIREARLRRGWTQTRLHLAADVNLADISRVENNRLVPTRAQLKKLADALEIPRDTVLSNLEQTG